jgi:type III secretion system FlhB-like substrate exporter
LVRASRRRVSALTPLHLALDCKVEVDQPIPEALFDAVADLMAWAHRGRRQAAAPDVSMHTRTR